MLDYLQRATAMTADRTATKIIFQFEVLLQEKDLVIQQLRQHYERRCNTRHALAEENMKRDDILNDLDVESGAYGNESSEDDLLDGSGE